MKKIAFTIVEFLITIAIIGVIAAMSLPTLIQMYNNHITALRLEKFYVDFNHAIKLSEMENGPQEYWTDWAEKNSNNSTNCYKTRDVIYKYIKPHLKIQKFDTYTSRPIFVLSDGSAFVFKSTTMRDMWYYPKNYKKCLKGGNNKNKKVCTFMFQVKLGKGLVPHLWDWDGTDENLHYLCYEKNHYGTCVEIFRRNNWRIPKDYPFKIRY